MSIAVAERPAETRTRLRVNTIFDVELTNKCNASCIMCPRDRTPTTGLMGPKTFDRIVARAVEYGRVQSFVMCGLGEPFLHPDIISFVRTAAESGIRPTIVTNGSLMTREKSKALVRAGVKEVNVSIGGYTRKTYEHVHRGLKFDTVYRNVMDFLNVAAGKAHLGIQISPTEESYQEAEQIAEFWRGRGARFCFVFPFEASRGGVLSEADAERSRSLKKRLSTTPRGCVNIEELFRPSKRDARIMRARAPFVCYPKDRFAFISWQGEYHLCCNDYQKEYPLGSVFDLSADEAYELKARVTPENTDICAKCEFSNGDLEPRGTRFYLGAAAYVVGSALKKLNVRAHHPDLVSIW